MVRLLAVRISHALREAGLTQQDAGQQLGMSQEAVSAWSCGRTVPNALQLQAIAELTGRDAAYFTDPGRLLDEPADLESDPPSVVQPALDALATAYPCLDTDMQKGLLWDLSKLAQRALEAATPNGPPVRRSGGIGRRARFRNEGAPAGCQEFAAVSARAAPLPV